jgi:hypothetical protein
VVMPGLPNAHPDVRLHFSRMPPACIALFP